MKFDQQEGPSALSRAGADPAGARKALHAEQRYWQVHVMQVQIRQLQVTQAQIIQVKIWQALNENRA